MKNLIPILAIFFFLTSCSTSIDPITYGEEACDFCSMTIVDQSHAAQVVTDKGKNFKFDAAECMIQYLKTENNEEIMTHILVSDYLKPGNMLNARDATFLISENIPSPMGAFLSAMASKEDAEKVQKESGGETYTWDAVKDQIGSSMQSHH